MALTVLGLVAAYLIGAIPIGFLVARAAGGTDIRRSGSGNIGATNVLRTLGRGPAVLTLVGDIVKGYLAVAAARAIGTEAWSAAGGAVAAVAGNCWPLFLAFRGGKGMATGLGAFLAVVPWAVAPAAVLWLGVTSLSRYVSLASILSCLSLPLAAALLGYPRHSVVAAALVALIITWRHRENITRLASGTEHRLGDRARAA
ncbi:MAG TPA: glycerol-3-phosphate 1-O-acyltransferase PlsY [Methylomirabilota bacterium]|jgi:acyl phosphate:glycerol-3-phosphate acyltransferase|nr:glycerol-3-phosphate 1-O-acyltransferase PlsY [Methylomirabilota bacterium]